MIPASQAIRRATEAGTGVPSFMVGPGPSWSWPNRSWRVRVQMTRSWVEVGWSWPSARRQVSTSASAMRCSLLRSSTGTGSSLGVVLVVPAEQLVGPTVQFGGDDGAPFGVELAGDLGHAVPVLPGPQPVLGLHPFPLAAPVVLGVPLDELVQPLAELEGRLARPGGEQVRFVLVQGGPGRRVGLGSGVGDGFGVFVGDGPVLEGVLGLGQLTELGGGLGPAFGLARARSSVCGSTGQRCPWPGRTGRSRGRPGPGAAGFAPGGPGPHPFGQSESFVDLGAGELRGVPARGRPRLRPDRTPVLQYQPRSMGTSVRHRNIRAFWRSGVGVICRPDRGHLQW